MRFVQIGFGILIVGGLTALGCGDDGTASAPPASGGTSGKGGSAGATTGGSAGSATGGTGGTGGTTGGTGGTTGGTGGTTGGTGGTGGATGGSAGAATGGSSGAATGGSAGIIGSGGEGGGTPGEACPATAPDDGDDCDGDVNPGGGDDPCTYGTTEVTTCSCGGFGMMQTWNCQTLSCPMDAPMSGDMCDGDTNPGGGDDPCVYGMTECTCGGGGPGGGGDEWECSAPAMCPTAAPTDGDMCDTDTDPGPMDGGCTFGMTTCVCGGMGGGGMMPTWNCGTCPAMEPDDGDDCDSDVNAFCAFAGGNCTCGAMNDEWNCF